ncbi:type II 3-dehydroquinate dehydratase [bacterium]|nr:MAG: type II 3-dehydroquinate dehydratase [bacterium]RKZ18180.1 MAG: type II 3-dehydroquinate dehydratase [bacterium]
MNLLVLHGPNLNRLGQREPEIYGNWTLEEIDQSLKHLAVELGVTLDAFQSNHEGELIDRIQESEHVDAFLVNAAGLSHTSVSLRDALTGSGKPFVEVHCSNVAAREEFRQVSLLAPVAVGTVQGFGPESYRLGLRALAASLAAGQ